MESYALENINVENTKNVVIVPSTDFEIDCQSNEVVEKIEKNIKIEGLNFLMESITENELHFIINFNMEEDKPEKKVSEMNRTDTDTQHYCNLCNKMYKTLEILKNHKAKDHEGVNYPCDRCDYKATRKSNLIRHTRQATFSKKIKLS